MRCCKGSAGRMIEMEESWRECGGAASLEDARVEAGGQAWN
jgi:hypothetical protein